MVDLEQYDWHFKVQQLMKATGVGANTGGQHNNQEKEVDPTSTDGGGLQGLCGHCNKRARHKRKDCPVCLTSGNGNNSHSGSNKMCNHCGTKGRVEKYCWKKNPENAPAWYKTKKEASGASIGMMLASI